MQNRGLAILLLFVQRYSGVVIPRKPQPEPAVMAPSRAVWRLVLVAHRHREAYPHRPRVHRPAAQRRRAPERPQQAERRRPWLVTQPRLAEYRLLEHLQAVNLQLGHPQAVNLQPEHPQAVNLQPVNPQVGNPQPVNPQAEHPQVDNLQWAACLIQVVRPRAAVK